MADPKGRRHELRRMVNSLLEAYPRWRGRLFVLSIPTRFTPGLLARALGFALVAAGLSAQEQQPPMAGDGSAPAAQEQSGSATGGRLRPRSRFREAADHARADSSRRARSSFRTSPKRPASTRGGTPWARRKSRYILETNGSGVCLLDYDNDGWLDIYIVNGSTFDALSRQGRAAACRSVPQQPRRNIYQRCRKGGRDQRPMGIWRGGWRL